MGKPRAAARAATAREGRSSVPSVLAAAGVALLAAAVVRWRSPGRTITRVRHCTLSEAIREADRGNGVCVGSLKPPASLAPYAGPFSEVRDKYRNSCAECNVQLLTSVHPDDHIYGAHRRLYARDESGGLHARDDENGGWEYYEPNPNGGAPLGPYFDPEPFHTREVGQYAALSRAHAALATNRTYLRCICNGAQGRREIARLGDAWRELFGSAADAPLASRLRGVNMFLSKPRALTNLHYDTNMHTIMYQLRGSKRFVLFPPRDSERLYENSESAQETGRYFPRRSSITGDVENISALVSRFPLLRNTTRRVVTLQAGQWLVLPANWWHAVRTLNEESHSWSVVVEAPS